MYSLCSIHSQSVAHSVLCRLCATVLHSGVLCSASSVNSVLFELFRLDHSVLCVHFAYSVPYTLCELCTLRVLNTLCIFWALYTLHSLQTLCLIQSAATVLCTLSATVLYHTECDTLQTLCSLHSAYSVTEALHTLGCICSAHSADPVLYTVCRLSLHSVLYTLSICMCRACTLCALCPLQTQCSLPSANSKDSAQAVTVCALYTPRWTLCSLHSAHLLLSVFSSW